jgi:predicted Zn-dependent peptidase
MKPAVKKLNNGIPVVLSPQDGAASMTLFVFCRVGSRYEAKETNGASHFIEHLMFKGTKRRPSTEALSRLLDRYGAEYNAMTSKDYTGYYVKMDAKQTALAADLLHDMMFHSLYDPKEIDRERGVIIEEINMYEDNPRMHIDDLLEHALFPHSTLGWNIAGPRDVIRNVTREQLIAYRDAYYIPERLTVVVAGKVVPGLMSILEKTFGRLKPPACRLDATFDPFVPPATLRGGVAFEDKQTEQAQLGIAFHGLPHGHPDLAAAKLLATILGGTMSSRLFIEVRERRGLCYSISADHQPLEDTGVFGILAGLDKTRLELAVATIRGELEKMKKNRVSPTELSEAKENIRGRMTLAFEDSSFQADWYGKQYMFLGRLETPADRMKLIDRVTAADVKRVAETIFRPDMMASAVIGPFGRRETLEKYFDWE